MRDPEYKNSYDVGPTPKTLGQHQNNTLSLQLLGMDLDM